MHLRDAHIAGWNAADDGFDGDFSDDFHVVPL
jgi:hypothetical protein